jgi:hypothetical protein
MGGVSLNVGSQAIGGSKNIDYLNKIEYNKRGHNGIFLTSCNRTHVLECFYTKNAYFCNIFV